jgi:hypothetical protein
LDQFLDVFANHEREVNHAVLNHVHVVGRLQRLHHGRGDVLHELVLDRAGARAEERVGQLERGAGDVHSVVGRGLRDGGGEAGGEERDDRADNGGAGGEDFE